MNKMRSMSGIEDKDEMEPIFDELEICYISLKDKQEEDRITELFKKHGGVVRREKGTPISTHAVVDIFEPALEHKKYIVQVTPQWVYACVRAGKLEDEYEYQPPRDFIDLSLDTPPRSSQKRKEPCSSSSLLEEKKKKRPLLMNEQKQHENTQGKEETNYLAKFLKNGDDIYKIIYKQGHFTTLENLNKAFSNHMRYKYKIEKTTIGTDYYPIKAAGFTIRRDNICKICHLRAIKEVCGDHYNPNNRYRRFVIMDMQLKKHNDSQSLTNPSNNLSLDNAYGIKWFYSKQSAKEYYLEKYGSNAFWFKLGHKMFAAMPNRQALIELCVEVYQQEGFLPYFYELVHGSHPRLYLDIEMEYLQRQEPPTMSGVIKDVLGIVRSKLAELTGLALEDQRIQNTIDTVNHRWKTRDADGKKMWNLSCHIVFPHILFEHNNRGMALFVQKAVEQEIQKKDELLWLKRCKLKCEQRSAVDQRTYSHEQAFRLMFTSKTNDPNNLLLPYDLENERLIIPRSPQEVEAMLDKTLISRASVEGCVIITDAQVCEFLGERPVQPSPVTQKPCERQTFSHAPAAEDEREFVANQVLPNLNRKRYSEVGSWLKIGYGLSSVFGGDEVGLGLFKKWSATASNYDEKECEKIYAKSNGAINFGSFLTWLKEDEPELGSLIIKRFHHQQDEARFAEPEEKEIEEEKREEIEEEIEEEKKEEQKEEQKEDEKEEEKSNEDTCLNVTKLDRQWVLYQRECGLIQKEIKLFGRRGHLIADLEKCHKKWRTLITDYINKFLALVVRIPDPAVVEQYYGENAAVVIRKQTAVQKLYMNRPWIRWWWKDARRQQYDEIVFNPAITTHTDRQFNLFTGLKYPRPIMSKEEAERVCEPILHHVNQYWCQNELRVYEYVMNWMAHLVQRPHIKMAAALVIRGDEGCGKGIITQKLADVLGKEYFYQVHDADASLFGRFTPQNFERCLLLYVDEAVWGGNRAQAGKLKKIISEPTHEIEHKHSARFTVQSYMNVIFASNESWVVPVGFKGRRFCCLDCNNDRAGINSASDALWYKEIASIDPGAFASYLYHRDITSFNPRAVPTTNMLRNQKRKRFDSVAQFWSGLLEEGDLSVPYEQTTRKWGDYILNTELFSMYMQFKGSDRGPNRPCDLIRQLRQFCTFRNITKKQLNVPGEEKKKYVTLLPSLADARAEFCKKVDDPDWFLD